MEPYSYRTDPAVPDFPDDAPVVVFDGHCAMCSGFVDFLLARDGGRYRFVAAQSELGEALYAHYGFKSGDYDTNILIENGLARTKSDGSLAILEGLGGPWRALRVLRLAPRFVRDAAYRVIARNRLRWFGRRDTCRVATPAERARFL